MKSAFCSIALLLGLIVQPVAAQSSNPNLDQVKYKDPGTATLLAVMVTGGGHLYAGEAGKGLLLMLAGGGAFLVGTAMTTASSDDVGYYSYESDINWTPFVIGSAVYLGTWIYGIADAPKAARRTNAKNGLGATPIQIAPYLIRDKGNTEGGIRVSLSLSSLPFSREKL